MRPLILSKRTKILTIVAAITIFPPLFASGSFADNLPQTTQVQSGNTGIPDSGGPGTVIFSDMGNPGSYSYQSGIGYTTSGSTSTVGGTINNASEFTSPGNFSVGEIDLGIGYVSGTNEANFSIWTDVNGLPGTQIGNAFQVSGLPAFGTCCSVVSVTGISGIDLMAGTDYFLLVSSGSNPGNDTYDAWNFANTATGLVDQQISGVWTQYPGFDLGAFALISTPEPGSLALLALGLGLLGLGGLFRRPETFRQAARR